MKLYIDYLNWIVHNNNHVVLAVDVRYIFVNYDKKYICYNLKPTSCVYEIFE